MIGTAPRRIQTERLVLRCWEPDDAEALLEAINVSLEHLRTWMPWAAFEPTTLGEKRELLSTFRDAFHDGSNFVYGIFDPDERVVLGGTGLHARGGPDELEIGYWIRADATRRGYATEVTAVLTRIVIEHVGLARAVVKVDPLNEPSLGVPRKLGYAEAGPFPSLLEPLPGEIERRPGVVFTLTRAQLRSSPVDAYPYHC
ncbi:MAG: GNAT family N-acetyltransferase [Gaiellales bacterium]